MVVAVVVAESPSYTRGQASCEQPAAAQIVMAHGQRARDRCLDHTPLEQQCQLPRRQAFGMLASWGGACDERVSDLLHMRNGT